MVMGSAVLGWGVGGIEAEAAMLGKPGFDADSYGAGLQADGRDAGGGNRNGSRV